MFEIGCGTGRHTEKLVNLGNEVTALDQSGGMLGVARAKPILAKVNFIESDIFQYHGQDFDAVLSSLILEHIDDLGAFFSKVSTFLKIGGEAFFSEIHPSRMSAGSGARFKQGDAEEIWLDSVPHTEADFRVAIANSGLVLKEKAEIIASAELIAYRPEWQKYGNRPMLQIWHLVRMK